MGVRTIDRERITLSDGVGMILSRRVLSTLWALLLVFTLGTAAGSVVHPPEPEIISVFPLAGRQGTALDAEIRGKNLQGAHTLWADHDGIQADITGVERIDLGDKDAAGRQKKEKEKGYRVSLQIKTAATVEAGLYSLRLVSAAGISNAFEFRVTADPVFYDTKQLHTTLQKPQNLTIPALVNGKISQQGEVDYYSFEAAKDQELGFTATSNLKSLLGTFDLVRLTLYEATGNWFDPEGATQLAFTSEPKLKYRFSKSGRYILGVGTYLGIGGPDCFYHLVVGPASDRWSDLKEQQSRPKPEQAGWRERDWDRKLDLNRVSALKARSVLNSGSEKEAPGNRPSPSPSGEAAGEAARIVGIIGEEPVPLDTVPLDNGTASLAENESTNESTEAAPQVWDLSVPALVEGAIERPGDVDSFKLRVASGQQLAFEIEAPQAAYPKFGPRLAVLDAEGKELFTNIWRRKPGGANSHWAKTLEPKTLWKFSRAGEYKIQLRDITSRFGNPTFRYRLLIRPQVPHIGNAQLQQDHINLVAGGARKLTVIVEREEGFDGFAAVKIAQLPPGVEAVPTTEYETDKTLSDEDRERYAPESQTVTVMLIAKADAPLTTAPAFIRVTAQPVIQDKLGDPFFVRGIPLMVIQPQVVAQEASEAEQQ